MNRLTGKIALITGGNSGIGLATARLFAAEGARVIITGRRQEELDAAVKSIGHGVEGVRGDVSNLTDLDRLFDGIRQKYGQLHVVLANAGIGQLCPVQDVTEEHFDRHFDINVKGLFFTVQKSLPLLKDGGSIILNASIAAQKGMEAFSVYCATKAAVRSFARTWTNDLKSRRIRVNSLSPGPVETPIFGKMGLTTEQVAQFGTAIVSQVPLGRAGQPEEIAHAALFLASEESSYVTGIDLQVDGGMAQV